jgi:hypothetical protein
MGCTKPRRGRRLKEVEEKERLLQAQYALEDAEIERKAQEIREAKRTAALRASEYNKDAKSLQITEL